MTWWEVIVGLLAMLVIAFQQIRINGLWHEKNATGFEIAKESARADAAESFVRSMRDSLREATGGANELRRQADSAARDLATVRAALASESQARAIADIRVTDLEEKLKLALAEQPQAEFTPVQCPSCSFGQLVILLELFSVPPDASLRPIRTGFKLGCEACKSSFATNEKGQPYNHARADGAPTTTAAAAATAPVSDARAEAPKRTPLNWNRRSRAGS